MFMRNIVKKKSFFLFSFLPYNFLKIFHKPIHLKYSLTFPKKVISTTTLKGGEHEVKMYTLFQYNPFIH